ncbi:hypothetical protein DdX_18213 [Ditylenchus destructor]|uniref:F-box domain-containing protein n=1 Tax=Ditylenchus destructor TaxID=166010 RepID=A0AAD4QSZ1_9BILA|nr:hypothetical protein DdX_18213 [Ditylenchus destructor]
MNQNRTLVPITTTIDIFALFNRKELFSLSKACRRYNSIIEQQFAETPYLVFDLLVRGSRWKWAPNGETETTNMQTRLVPLLKASKFVRFRNTVFIPYKGRSLVDELAPVKHVFDGRHLQIDPGLDGHSNATVDLVRKCRVLTIEMSSAADDAIFSGLLSNDHERIDVKFASEDNHSVLILPVKEIVDFLMRSKVNGNSYKKLIIETLRPLDIENCTQIVETIKEKFLASTAPVRFKFELNYDVDEFNEELITVRNEKTRQNLTYAIARDLFSDIMVICQTG